MQDAVCSYSTPLNICGLRTFLNVLVGKPIKQFFFQDKVLCEFKKKKEANELMRDLKRIQMDAPRDCDLLIFEL